MPQPRYSPKGRYDPVNAEQRLGSIRRALTRTYGRPRTWLTYRDPFELLIATILSAQCTDEMVNKVTPALFERYPTPEALAGARPSDVQKLIKPTGFFRQKTTSLIGCSRRLVEAYAGQVPATIDDLVTLPGVARKTANVVLANCFPEADHGIFVDTHIRRTSQRLGLTDQEDPVKVERQLMDLLPRTAWVDVPHQLILLGRGPCDARSPKHDECPLLRWCPSGQQALGTGAARPAARARATPARKARPPRSARRTRG